MMVKKKKNGNKRKQTLEKRASVREMKNRSFLPPTPVTAACVFSDTCALSGVSRSSSWQPGVRDENAQAHTHTHQPTHCGLTDRNTGGQWLLFFLSPARPLLLSPLTSMFILLSVSPTSPWPTAFTGSSHLLLAECWHGGAYYWTNQTVMM